VHPAPLHGLPVPGRPRARPVLLDVPGRPADLRRVPHASAHFPQSRAADPPDLVAQAVAAAGALRPDGQHRRLLVLHLASVLRTRTSNFRRRPWSSAMETGGCAATTTTTSQRLSALCRARPSFESTTISSEFSMPCGIVRPTESATRWARTKCTIASSSRRTSPAFPSPKSATTTINSTSPPSSCGVSTFLRCISTAAATTAAGRSSSAA
jgi:hypothetical protein